MRLQSLSSVAIAETRRQIILTIINSLVYLVNFISCPSIHSIPFHISTHLTSCQANISLLKIVGLHCPFHRRGIASLSVCVALHWIAFSCSVMCHFAWSCALPCFVDSFFPSNFFLRTYALFTFSLQLWSGNDLQGNHSYLATPTR
ncbi:Schizosaccharomyces pombe specific protein [Schizosaccharomyces pombe]|uniref:Meiotically up-regulated gene 124 protein n=1 Tax=Schizosaccharomyces pombe (strain 972 / ATCC 24843) TaxID=284812 RepID=MU124_SCHPO|nr:protein mug124 [Schizosaccharomyces pombe]Q9UUD4.1 RecName: Full=Meiotically up-regulated gene 124 protein [Schizosaccharomyces pombe 972h-]CAB52033.1 sequence orphan [Schizosaccharomyces pombe]|eukprot:NP_595691.1 protein mug124 [Schizosaccharomyces pombe]